MHANEWPILSKISKKNVKCFWKSLNQNIWKQNSSKQKKQSLSAITIYGVFDIFTYIGLIVQIKKRKKYITSNSIWYHNLKPSKHKGLELGSDALVIINKNVM